MPIAIQHSVRCFFVSPPYVRRGIHEKRGRQYQSSGYQSFWLLVPCGLARLSPFGPPGTLKTGGTQSLAPTYPVDWRGSVLLPPPISRGLAGLSPLGPQVPCGRARLSPCVLFATRHPVDWLDSVLSGPGYPVDLRDSVRFAPQVLWGPAGLSPFSPQGPCGLVGLSHFSPPGTLRTESSKMTRTGESSTESRGLVRTGTGTLTTCKKLRTRGKKEKEKLAH